MARSVRRPLALALLAGALLVCSSGPALAQADEGEALFQEKCSGCHTIGGGALVGPDLQGAVDRRGGPDATAAFIVDPAGTAMPNLGVTADQAAAIVAFLSASAAPPETPPTETAPPETAPAPGTGDAVRGKNLFEGRSDFDGGGPACLSCHSVAGIGALGGGALGPDLTGAFAKYNGETGLVASLTTVAFPTMQPVYTGAPITEQEARDLAAFLAEAPQATRPGGSAWKLFVLSIGGVAAFAAFALLVWRSRLAGVRRPLLRRLNPRQK
ncbi:MAG: c-type cytochrome [Thermoleophilia bacterium]|nr:c-type cytochrome [Thermoleophilia bacterium]